MGCLIMFELCPQTSVRAFSLVESKVTSKYKLWAWFDHGVTLNFLLSNKVEASSNCLIDAIIFC